MGQMSPLWGNKGDVEPSPLVTPQGVLEPAKGELPMGHRLACGAGG
jgi:hypothetical protein